MSRPAPDFPRTVKLLSRTQPEHFAGNESLTSSSSQTLSALTSEQVRILDMIISRAPGATTFLAIFKTYNDVLEELSMDASSDVVYYKLLLKLGVVKGKDWGEKWRTVKTQMLASSERYSVDDDDDSSPPGTPRVGGYHEQDGISMGSQMTEEDEPTPQPRAVRQWPQSGRLPALDVGGTRQPAAPKPQPFRTPLNPNSNRHTPLRASTSSDSYANDSNYAEYALTREEEQQNGFHTPAPANHHRANSTPIPRRPNPNHVRIVEPQPQPQPQLPRGQAQAQVHPPSRATPLLSTFGRFPTRSTRKPDEADPSTHKPPPSTTAKAINADEAWKHLEMERDADDFREISILRAYWHVWRRRSRLNADVPQHFIDKQTMRVQRATFETWHERFSALQGRYIGASSRADSKIAKRVMKAWMGKWEARQVKKWTDDMRQRLSWFQGRQRTRLVKSAWEVCRLLLSRIGWN